VRLNPNGSVDNSFIPGTGADDRIWNINRLADGSLMAYGGFQSFNGSPRKCIARLNADGSLHSNYETFDIAHGGATVSVRALKDSPLGLLIGGYFTGYGGKYHARLARAWADGSADPTFTAWGNETFKCISVQQDGKILAVGDFGNVYGYEPRTGLARYHPDGTVDLGFRPVVLKADGAFADLAWVEPLDNGQIMIGGEFTQVADAAKVMQPRIAVARLNADGTLDPSFNAQINIPDGYNIRVNGGGEIDGKYYIGGYVYYNEMEAGFFTRFTSTGAPDTSFGSAGGPAAHVNLFNGEVRCGTSQNDDKIIVAGDFTQMIDGSPAPPLVNHIARFTTAGLLDTTFAANPGANGPIHAIDRQRPGDKLFVGGVFSAYHGVARPNLARLHPDGSLDAGFDPGAGPNGAVYAINYNSSTKRLRIGGAFTAYSGVPRSRVAQLFAGSQFLPAVPLLLEPHDFQ
jgi:uncharacterized delta-60 repeat protein